MSEEFRRLLDDASSLPLRRVLETGLRDQPSKKDLARAAQALGIGVAGLGVAQSAAAVETARALHGPVWAALAKWGGVGLVASSIALSPVAYRVAASHVEKAPAAGAASARARSHRASLAASSSPAVVSAAPSEELAPVAHFEHATAELKVPTEPHRERHAADVSKARSGESPMTPPPAPLLSTAAAFPAPPSNELDVEVSLLDAARRALRSAGPSAALALLDQHDRLRARSLAAESTLLRVQALMAAGRVTDAQAIARGALANSNASAYAARLRQLARHTP